MKRIKKALLLFIVVFVLMLNGCDRGSDVNMSVRDEVNKPQATAHPAYEKLPWAEARGKLRPQLLPASFLSQLPGPIVHRPFPLGKDLIMGLVLDKPGAMLYVPVEWIEEWRVSPELAMDRAFDNLRGDVSSFPLGNSLHSGLTSGKYVATDKPASYVATRIVLPEEQKLMCQLLGPNPICAVPNREFLVCWSADYDKDQQARAKARRDYQTYSYPISPDPFVIPCGPGR